MVVSNSISADRDADLEIKFDEIYDEIIKKIFLWRDRDIYENNLLSLSKYFFINDILLLSTGP